MRALTAPNLPVRLVMPVVTRDSALSVRWLTGGQGRETLQMMGVPDDRIVLASLDSPQREGPVSSTTGSAPSLLTQLASWSLARLSDPNAAAVIGAFAGRDEDAADVVIGAVAGDLADPWLCGQAWRAGYDEVQAQDRPAALTPQPQAPWWVRLLPDYEDGRAAATAEVGQWREEQRARSRRRSAGPSGGRSA